LCLQIIQELNAAQIDLVHVAAISKNAADEKLRQSLRRFAEHHKPPSAVVLISSDVNFASDLSNLRHKRKIRVILVHQQTASETLIVCSDEHHDYANLTRNLPQRALGKVNTLDQLYITFEYLNLRD
jgi:meiosis arrest female protein 1